MARQDDDIGIKCVDQAPQTAAQDGTGRFDSLGADVVALGSFLEHFDGERVGISVSNVEARGFGKGDVIDCDFPAAEGAAAASFGGVAKRKMTEFAMPTPPRRRRLAFEGEAATYADGRTKVEHGVLFAAGPEFRFNNGAQRGVVLDDDGKPLGVAEVFAQLDVFPAEVGRLYDHSRVIVDQAVHCDADAGTPASKSGSTLVNDLVDSFHGLLGIVTIQRHFCAIVELASDPHFGDLQVTVANFHAKDQGAVWVRCHLGSRTSSPAGGRSDGLGNESESAEVGDQRRRSGSCDVELFGQLHPGQTERCGLVHEGQGPGAVQLSQVGRGTGGTHNSNLLAILRCSHGKP